MESLGGDQLWFDRFLAEHASLLYYWGLILIYLFSPRLAYAFSELVEWHAADTYEQFVESNRQLLAELPPPIVAAEYYRNSDLYMVSVLGLVTGTYRVYQLGIIYLVFLPCHVKIGNCCVDIHWASW
eukprot:GHRR01029320.1.p2 GENE.GHRR01029320.1~~GHRR01029320.1.p2  ORF type:complete len:127 (+),score=30.21 GHRR01029320.1:301-681(+)